MRRWGWGRCAREWREVRGGSGRPNTWGLGGCAEGMGFVLGVLEAPGGLGAARGRFRVCLRGRTWSRSQGWARRTTLSLSPALPPRASVPTPASHPGKQLVWSGRLTEPPPPPPSLPHPRSESRRQRGRAGPGSQGLLKASLYNPLQVLSTAPHRACLVCQAPPSPDPNIQLPPWHPLRVT